jgi:hypothetical protein
LRWTSCTDEKQSNVRFRVCSDSIGASSEHESRDWFPSWVEREFAAG